MHHAPQPGNDDHQAALLPIRELPAVGMLIALALVLALDGCMHTDIWGSGILRGCCGALTGSLGAAAGG